MLLGETVQQASNENAVFCQSQWQLSSSRMNCTVRSSGFIVSRAVATGSHVAGSESSNWRIISSSKFTPTDYKWLSKLPFASIFNNNNFRQRNMLFDTPFAQMHRIKIVITIVSCSSNVVVRNFLTSCSLSSVSSGNFQLLKSSPIYVVFSSKGHSFLFNLRKQMHEK